MQRDVIGIREGVGGQAWMNGEPGFLGDSDEKLGIWNHAGLGSGCGGEVEREGREEEPKCPLWRNYKLMQMRKKPMLLCQKGNPG